MKHATFSIFNNAGNIVPAGVVDLGTLIGEIRSGKWQEQVERVRSLKAAGDEAGASMAKRGLPCVSLSCEMRTRSAKVPVEERILKYSGLLQIDLDGKDNPALVSSGAVRELADDEHVLSAFRSPSGDGLKLVVPVEPVPEGESVSDWHRRTFETAKNYFAGKGFLTDGATKDVVRLCFVSFDRFAILKDSAKPFPPAAKQVQKPKVYFPPADSKSADIAEMLALIPAHPEYQDWLRICSAVWNELGETGTDLLKSWSPEDVPGEYERKFKNRLLNIGLGTLVFYAKQYGFDAVIAARKAKWGGRVYFGSGDVPERTIESRISEQEAPADDGNDWRRECFLILNGQAGAAEVFANCVRNEWRYDVKLELWRFYDGKIWQTDESGNVKIVFRDKISEKVDKLIDFVQYDMRENPAPDGMDDSREQTLKDLGKLKISVNQLKTVVSCLVFAQSFLAISAADFDKNPMLLACGNGTLDFSVNDFRQSCSGDFLTKSIPVNCVPEAVCPHFEKFVNDIFNGNDELVRYVQRVVGYCLTGNCDENCLFFFYGKGANGKSIFRSAMEMLFGGLKTEISINALLTQTSDTNADYQKARLKGARIAFTDEIPSNKRFRAGQIKSLTGSDTILARNPYERPYSFTPTHKLILIGNDQPMISEMDFGTWRRINVIPFTRTFSKEEQIPSSQFFEWFSDELSGILNWAIRGWIDYQQQGLNPPEEVKLATTEYQADNDQLSQFMDESITPCEGGKIRTIELFKGYVHWCEDNGLHPTIQTKNKLTNELKTRGFNVANGKGNVSCLFDYDFIHF